MRKKSQLLTQMPEGGRELITNWVVRNHPNLGIAVFMSVELFMVRWKTKDANTWKNAGMLEKGSVSKLISAIIWHMQFCKVWFIHKTRSFIFARVLDRFSPRKSNSTVSMISMVTSKNRAQ